jgi:K+/H+ antiporter YhaU regulatory subunit KhtT
LKIIFTPTLNNTADIFTKNPTEEVFNTHAPKLVGPIPNKTELCNFTSARYEDLVLENDDHDWIVVSKQKKKKKKPNIQSILPCFKGTKKKPLTQK